MMNMPQDILLTTPSDWIAALQRECGVNYRKVQACFTKELPPPDVLYKSLVSRAYQTQWYAGQWHGGGWCEGGLHYGEANHPASVGRIHFNVCNNNQVLNSQLIQLHCTYYTPIL